MWMTRASRTCSGPYRRYFVPGSRVGASNPAASQTRSAEVRTPSRCASSPTSSDGPVTGDSSTYSAAIAPSASLAASVASRCSCSAAWAASTSR